MEQSEFLEGYDEKILKKLSSEKDLSITRVRRTFVVGYPRAKEMWKALRSGREHALSGGTFREFYFTQEKLDYWAQQGAGLFDLGDYGEESIEKKNAIREVVIGKLKQHCFDFYTFDISNPKKLLKHFLLIYGNGEISFKFFEDLQMLANSYTGGKFFVLDDKRGMIYERSLSGEQIFGCLTIEKFDEIVGVGGGRGTMIHFPCGIARMGMGFVFRKKENPFKKVEKVFKSLDTFKVIDSQEEMDKFFDVNQNSYVFFEDVFINFNFSNPDVNISGKNLSAKNLKIRNLSLDGGIFVDDLECRDFFGEFLSAHKGLKCANLQCKVVKVGSNLI